MANENVSFDGQIYTCLKPKWPKDSCLNAIANQDGRCMYLRIDQDNRCDNIKNVAGESK